MSDTLYKIKVMQAWEDGKSIRYIDGLPLGKKKDFCNPDWNWPEYPYEIVPDTVYANIYEGGGKSFYNNEADAKNLSSLAVIRVAVKYEEVIE